MPDYSNPSRITLIFGQSSGGKTSFAFSYLLNQKFACRFIFDDFGLAATRLRIQPCSTQLQCERALASRWVVFNPHVYYPGARMFDGLRWFISWACQVSARAPGRKVLLVDELWQWSNSRKPVFAELEYVIRTMRIEGLEFLSATHSPREYHELIRSQATEFVAFNTIEPGQLDSIRPYWPGVEKAAQLPKFHWLAFNRDSRAELAGQTPR